MFGTFKLGLMGTMQKFPTFSLLKLAGNVIKFLQFTVSRWDSFKIVEFEIISKIKNCFGVKQVFFLKGFVFVCVILNKINK